MLRSLIVLPDGTELYSGRKGDAIKSVSITDAVNEQTELTIGSVCSSMLEASIITPNGGLNIAEGTELTLYEVGDTGTRTKVGLFTLEKPTRPSANTYKMTAYDRVSCLDKDLTEWFSGLDAWPYRLFDLAAMVCAECGLILKNESISNGDYLVQQFFASGITGRKLMKKIGEACCRFGRATPDGEFEFTWYEDRGKTVTTRDFFQNGLSYEDYETYPIEKVQIKLTEDDVGVIWPNDAEALNTYIILGNYLLTTTSTEALQPVAQTIYEELKNAAFTPCRCALRAPNDIKAGDIVSITDKNGVTIKTYVMSRKRSGQKITIESNGSYRRDSVSRVNNQSFENAMRSKVFELSTGIEGLSAKASELEAKIEENAASTTEQITQMVQNSQSIIFTALEEYARTSDLESLKETVSAQLSILANEVNISVTEQQEKITSINDTLQQQINEITANYRFTADGQYIGKTDSDTMLRLINDMIQILVAGVAETTFDRTGMNAEQATIRTLHMGDYTLALGSDNHLTLS